ncbi:hypothetical protein GAO09_10700 [Rhizobiales bacterium RZME27]|jgi:DNA-binding response OmpR family regulator|uniref:Response regulatory domain-containing protein n=1 Tax=Endobacterium cereale TaxID=2663029 RepID=A0A6A8A5Y7_9HYPH|nr:hypothetical protein [Endobacterium cereale]MEB2846768.1 hypothetical protein [Endobacterium cereale]MQY46513.1 hypothetical protein [Endobacterium cereale]
MRRVLAVDDEASIRLPVIDAREDAGFEIDEANTTNEALDIIRRRHGKSVKQDERCFVGRYVRES